MMSDMEKTIQIGDLVQQRQRAITALGHLELKSRQIATAYSTFGQDRDRWRVDDDGAFLLHPKHHDESDYPRHLLGQAELAASTLKAAEERKRSL
jgi:hypothetical protein